MQNLNDHYLTLVLKLPNNDLFLIIQFVMYLTSYLSRTSTLDALIFFVLFGY